MYQRDILCCYMINPNDFGDFLTFILAPKSQMMKPMETVFLINFTLPLREINVLKNVLNL